MMLGRSRRVAIGVAVVAGLALPREAGADTISVLCSNGFKAVMETLAPQFEQATKNKVVVTYSVAAELKRRIDAGESFDLAILTPAAIDDLIARRTVVADTRSVLARSAMAIAIRAGTPRTDISTTEAFTRVLSQAK
jgi:molybdate transport system substrate-binding protein